jgi:S-DNA-T family DNA segregation ATPase FtsK/SpoIIIE
MLNGFQRLMEVGLILAGTISLYILITLFTFDPADPSWSKTGNYELIKNAGGAFGAWLADILLFTFGWLAFFIPVAVSIVGWLLFRKFHNLIEIDYLALGLRLIGIICFIIGASAISSVNFDDIYYFSSGGIIGDVISYLLYPLFGFAGSTLLLLVFVMAGITLMTGVSWMTIIDGLGKYTLLACGYIYTKLKPTDKPSVAVNDTVLETSVNDKETDAEPTLDTSSTEKETEVTVSSNDGLKPIPEKLSEKESESLLSQFFGNAEVSSEPKTANQETNIKAQVQDSDVEQEIVIEESQAAGLVENSDAAPISQNVKSKREVSLDDDMPLSIEDFESQPSFSAVDDEVSDDDISGALSGMQQAQNQAPERSTNAVLTPEPKPVKKEPITLPALELLDRPDKVENPVSEEELEAVSRLVEAKLLDFGVKADVVGVYPGPVITRFELDLAPGIKVSKISGLSKDLARSLSAMSVRVVEVIPGKSYIGIEIPNKHRLVVRLSEVMDTPAFQNAASPTTMVLGKDIAGKAVVVDLAKMPHLLVAGTTGSGKSVGVNTMILSLLYKSTPEEVRLIMIDPKMLELSVYEGIPHLLSEVVTDMKEAANALRWCVGEMERRYKLMSALGVRNLKGYNAKIEEGIASGKPVRDPLWRPTDNMLEMPPELEKLPAIVVVIDEFADMMMIVGKKVEELIARIAQKARAAGIHLVLATQRPSVDVITGLIKANIPTRMAFQVSSKIDSRTILDQQGAENLLGMGDMLYLPPGSSAPTRVHGAFVDDHEVHAVVTDWKSKAKPNYVEEILQGEMTEENMLPGEAAEMAEDEDTDPLFDEAVAFVTQTRKVSISSIQRKLKIGYNRSANIVEQMEMMGIVTQAANNGSREVLAPPPVADEAGYE